jgi:cell division protease FtsH
MVMQYGMSARIGAIRLGQEQGEVFLGRDMGHIRDYSDGLAEVIDDEVRRLIENAHDEAWHILVDNRAVLDRLVLQLLEKETLDKAAVAEIFTDVRKRPEREVWLSSSTRPVSDLPPVTYTGNGSAANGSSVNGSSPNGSTPHADGDPDAGGEDVNELPPLDEGRVD